MHPSFVPRGPTSPVTLLFDDAGLTQLAGVYPVAWQTPWDAISTMQLLRTGRSMALFASVAGVRYRWSSHDLDDYEAVRAVVLANDGVVERRRRRAGVVVVVVVVLVASFAGAIASWFGPGSGPNELAGARAVNLSLKDVPSGWTSASASVLSYLFPPSTQVVTSTSTTAPPANSAWRRISGEFQGCLGVSAGKDRVYGAAGQMPDYQVSSPILSSAEFGGIELASTTQYYATTTMVQRDTAEMSLPNFGSCFAASNAAMIASVYSSSAKRPVGAADWLPATFAKGWARGGVVNIDLPGMTKPLHLVMVEATSGHFEVTLGAMVAQWPQSRAFLDNLVSVVKARMASPSASAV